VRPACNYAFRGFICLFRLGCRLFGSNQNLDSEETKRQPRILRLFAALRILGMTGPLGARRFGPSPRGWLKGASAVFAEDAEDTALDGHLLRGNVNRIHFDIRGLQPYDASLREEAFQRRL